MDFGYLLLRHVVQQVLGNLKQAAQATILPLVLAGIICWAAIAVALQVFEFVPTNDGNFVAVGDGAGHFFFVILFCLAVFTVCYSWAAVGWHRYILLEEYPSMLSARWNWPHTRGYIWAILRVLGMLLLLFIPIAIVVSILAQGIFVLDSGFGGFLQFGLNVGLTWALTRLALALPAAAVGKKMSVGESWVATKPVSSAILLPIVVIPLVFFGLMMLASIVGPLATALFILLGWIQLLINLALLTTLYGNLIEGRQLN